MKITNFAAIATAISACIVTGIPAASAMVPPAKAGPAAHVTTRSAPTPDLGGWNYVWKITHVGAATKAYGAWNNCISFSAESTAHTATCTITTTYTSTASGTVHVKLEDLSASVGYSVARGYSIAGGETYSVPSKKSGEIQWRRAFSDNAVTQKEYLCSISCQAQVYGTATANTQQYLGPNFRVVYN